MNQNQTQINFFKKWSSEMAYILGFIAADGNISIKKDRKNGFILNITNKDKKHLEVIKRLCCPQTKISNKRSGYTSKKDYYCLQLTNKIICQDLINLGIVPRKTYTFSLPKVPEECFSDFVRGFFDGDGTVYIYSVNNTSQIKAGFVSCSLKFIQEFNQRLCQSLKIIPKNIHRAHSKGKFPQYSICFYVDDCVKLANFMYQHSPLLFLSQKRKIFEKWNLIKRRGYIKKNYPSKVSLTKKVS